MERKGESNNIKRDAEGQKEKDRDKEEEGEGWREIERERERDWERVTDSVLQSYSVFLSLFLKINKWRERERERERKTKTAREREIARKRRDGYCVGRESRLPVYLFPCLVCSLASSLSISPFICIYVERDGARERER